MNVSSPLLTDEAGSGMYYIALRLLCYVCEHHKHNGLLKVGGATEPLILSKYNYNT